MSKIKSIRAREILDSRGNPTVETRVILDSGEQASAAVPSGASVGKYEAVELRDGDPKRFNGLGVLKVIDNINQVIGPKLTGFDPINQEEIDKLMIALDGTANKEELGANSILSISLAVCKAAALVSNLSLYRYINQLAKKGGMEVKIEKIPQPTLNIINGGSHGAGNLDFQEFHILPASNKPYRQGLRIGVEIYHALKKVLIYRGAVHSIGDEGGFAPNLYTNLDALEAISQAIEQASYKLGFDVFLGLDIAPAFFKKGRNYQIKDKSSPLETSKYIDFLLDLNSKHQLLLLEDPLDEDDWQSWKLLTSKIGEKTTIMGDDLLVTNRSRLEKAIKEKACSAILVKLNQVGTLTETLEVIKTAKQARFKTSISHRSGETNDSFIADLAVGVQSDFVKFGAPARGERVAKYNRLLKIEEELQ